MTTASQSLAMQANVSGWGITPSTLWVTSPATSKEGCGKFQPVPQGHSIEGCVENENQGGNRLTQVYLENGH